MADPSQSVLLRGGRSPRCCGEVGSACASASPSRGAYSEPTCSLAPGKMEKQHWGNHSWRCYSISQQSPPKPHVVQMKIDFWFFKNNILDQISTLPQQKAGLWDKTQNYNKSPIGCLPTAQCVLQKKCHQKSPVHRQIYIIISMGISGS